MFECVNCKKWEIWSDGFDGKYFFYICSHCGNVQKTETERD